MHPRGFAARCMVTELIRFVATILLITGLLVIIAILGFVGQNTTVDTMVMLHAAPLWAHLATMGVADIVFGSLIIMRVQAVKMKKTADRRLTLLIVTALAANTGMYAAFLNWVANSMQVVPK